MTAEIDERTLTPAAPAAPRYHGDTTVLSPNMHTARGFNIGRSLDGDSKSPNCHAGALHVFVSNRDNNLEIVESVIKRMCDHAQIHPGLLHTDRYSCRVGRGYWIRAELDNLVWLAPILSRMLVEPETTLMVPAADYPANAVHGRVIVPFTEVFGQPSLSAVEIGDIRDTLLNAGSVFEHLDFNGTHYGVTGDERVVDYALEYIRQLHSTSDTHVVGQTTFTPTAVNIEKYPVRMLS